MTYEVKDKVALVTGGAVGIGAKVVEVLLEEGIKYVAVLDVSEKQGVALQDELNKKHGTEKVKFIKCDVTNDDQLLGAFKSVVEEKGYIDIVVNNAGIMNDSESMYKKEILVNVLALVTSTRKAIELMRKDHGGKGGVVMNVSSIAGITISHMLPIYNATKSAVLQFSTCMGLEKHYSVTGVRVLAICFGATDTSLLSKEKFGAMDEAHTPHLGHVLENLPIQKVESAARALVEACKHGESGTSWLSIADQPVQNITEIVKKSYGVLNAMVFVEKQYSTK